MSAEPPGARPGDRNSRIHASKPHPVVPHDEDQDMGEQYPLTDLPRALIDAGFHDAPNYRACYEAARSAVIPARRNKAGRWTFDPADLGEIADRLGLLADAA